MTRRAAREGFERFVDRAVDVTYREFDVVAALSGELPTGPGAGFANRLLKRNRLLEREVVRPELERHRDAVLEQFGAVLDYAEDREAGIDEHADRILDANLYAQSLDPSLPPERRDRVLERLLDQQRRLGDEVAPIVRSPEDEFWAAATAELDADTARSLIEECFAFTAPVRDHRDAFSFRTEFDPASVLDLGPLAGAVPSVTVEYTDEALSAMVAAERAVIADAKREVDRRF